RSARVSSWSVELVTVAIVRSPRAVLFKDLGHQAAYCFRSLSRNRLLSAVTFQASGQKHRSTHHQSCGTPHLSSSGISLSKFSLPVANGLCVLVLCSFRLPSESIRWMWVILPLSFCSSSISPPGKVSFCPSWLAPTTAHMYAWQVS